MVNIAKNYTTNSCKTEKHTTDLVKLLIILPKYSILNLPNIEEDLT
jgi:hypothetical protein